MPPQLPALLAALRLALRPCAHATYVAEAQCCVSMLCYIKRISNNVTYSMLFSPRS
jgi:hypothetical protein